MVCSGCVQEWWLRKSERLEAKGRKEAERLLVSWLLRYHNATIVLRSSNLRGNASQRFQIVVTCDECHGTGTATGVRCGSCYGSGTVWVVFPKTSATSDGAIRIGDIELDPQRRIVKKSSRMVHLTPKEFDLLHQLMSNAGMPITHNRLLKSVWGPEYGNELEYVRTFARQLRIKLEDDPGRPAYLLTENQLGYRFIEPE